MSAAAARGSIRASIVIPTWNGARHLPTCLDALRAQRPVAEAPRPFDPASEAEILVVDNGSTDQSAEILARYPEVRVLALPENLGFAGGVNTGIRAARGEILVLLNNDTEAAPTWLAALVAGLDAAPEAGMAASKLRLFDRRDTLHTTGDTLDIAGFAANRGVWERDEGQHDEAREVFAPNAGAGAYRRRVLDDVGLFEEAFESYYEDVDLAWRARLAGHRCVFVPEAVVYHHLSATGGGPYASFRVARNRIWTIARCYPGPLLRRHLGAVLAAQLRLAADALRHVRGPEARATFRGLLAGALTWPRWLAARRRIQATRTVSLEELDALMRS